MHTFVSKVMYFKANVDQMISVHLHLTDRSGILPEKEAIPREDSFFVLFYFSLSETNVS